MPGESEHHTPDGNMNEKSDESSRQVSSSHMLGPHVVGQRVVVRRLLPGLTGPTGGPAFTDTLGVCLAWGDGVCALQREDGSVVSIRLAEIVSGKPVPPRPSVRLRVSSAKAERHVADLWPTCQTLDLAGWTVRTTPAGADGRRRKRGNSLLAIEAPVGLSPAEASRRAVQHYTALDLPTLAAVEPGSPGEETLLALGWAPLPDGRSAMLLAPVSRALRMAGPPAGSPITVETTESDREAVAVVQVDGVEVARGRAALTGTDWVGLEDLWVAPEQRRRGFARAVLGDLLDWAAAAGAMTVWLHVELDNDAARALYESLGFIEHHRMGYLRAPSVEA